ncbi:MAG: phosphate ABC transporter permease subunit PstC [Clostridiales bacterium]|nr:phosphate ABC transporter permease subunit PstC [Clostridiales bacterium]
MRLLKDALASKVMLVLTFFPGLVVFLIIIGLYLRGRPILAEKPLFSLLFSSSWAPGRGDFGFFPFIMGTLWVTAVALIVAVPISLLASIYLSEYAPRAVQEFIRPMIDLLAGLPSVIYGVWGVLLIVPLVARIAPFFGGTSSGYSILAGGLVLAIMIFPTIIYVSLEVISSIPYELREASLSLGATKWETVKHVVLKKGLQGIIAAIVLGLSRALGETMAVLMVVGNIPKVPQSVFDGGYPLPALIANNYGEMMSVPLYDSALMLAAGVLLVIVLVFNVLARIILVRVERRAG